MSQKHQAIAVVGMAILAITILEGIAMLKGINGTRFMLSIAAITGVAGFKLRDWFPWGR